MPDQLNESVAEAQFTVMMISFVPTRERAITSAYKVIVYVPAAQVAGTVIDS
jgi:hypothetical protein